MRTLQTIQEAKTASNRALALTESLPYGYFAGGELSLENNKIKISPLYASIHGKSVYKTSEYEIQASDWLCPQTSSFTYSVYIRDTGKVFVDRTEYIVNTMYIGKYHPVIPAIYLGSVAIDSAGAYEAVYSRDNLTYESFAGGIIASMNWSASYGSQINLNDGSFKLGGSANPKLSWDGNNLLISGGSVGGINISSTEMYLGMGNYNNADTPFYVNNTGSFSLGDRFVWDGANLFINATKVDWTVLSQTVDGDFTVKDGSNTHIIYKVDVTSGTSTGVFSANGNMTITKTTEQLRLGYNVSNYATFTVGSTGSLTIAATGTNPNITLTPGGTGYTILNGSVGIGTTTPVAKLHIVTQNSKTIAEDMQSWYSSGSDGLYPFTLTLGRSTQTNNYWYISGIFQGVSCANTILSKDGGNVGIGTTSPVGPLHVQPSSTTALYSGYSSCQSIITSETNITNQITNLALHDNSSVGINKGGGIGFGGKHTGDTMTTWAGIYGLKEVATDNNYAGYMSFYTRPTGSEWTEKMRITSTGNVGIGTTSPGARLEVYGNSGIDIKYAVDDGANQLRFVKNDGTILWALGGGVSLRQDELSIRHGTTSVMYFENTGNVGIGTTSPIVPLHVSKAGTTETEIARFSSTGGNPYITIGNGVTASTGGYICFDDTNDYLKISTHGTNCLFAKGTSVGINTATFTGSLNVHKVISNYNSTEIAIRAGDFSSGYDIYNIGHTLNSCFGLDTDVGDMWINYRGYNGGITRYRDFRIGDGKGNALLVVDGSAKNFNFAGDTYATFGANSTWKATLAIGGNGTQSGSTTASICTTNGNIHIDSRNGSYGVYLNYYSGTGGVYIGTGAGGANTQFDSAGRLGIGVAPNSSYSLKTSGDVYFGGKMGCVLSSSYLSFDSVIAGTTLISYQWLKVIYGGTAYYIPMHY